ncbi:acidic mammalian chitinase-like [Gigantopelta aegis]|uniref:acidic mammalian chitinase-like n=1 Tax=Gigantopelta aegis TaxID=1735272 RepID=UPI001B88ACEE|nr:acidic mammalian chitinase-like [Gigantopelta aegis]
MISVGGTSEANSVLALLVLSQQTRETFSRNAVKSLRKWKFDGLDVDWEFPGDPPETKVGLARLLEESAVNMWLERGAAADKIVVGIAGFGASFTLKDETETEVGSPVVGPGNAGPYRMTAGQLSYVEICLMLRNGGALRWDNEQQSPYAFLGKTWVGFDNHHSIEIKVNWMVSRGVGGAMFWSLDMDDFKGQFCQQGRFPLVRTIFQTAAQYFPIKIEGVPAGADGTNKQTKNTTIASSTNETHTVDSTVSIENVTTPSLPFPFNLPMNAAPRFSCFVISAIYCALELSVNIDMLLLMCSFGFPFTLEY